MNRTVLYMHLDFLAGCTGCRAVLLEVNGAFDLSLLRFKQYFSLCCDRLCAYCMI